MGSAPGNIAPNVPSTRTDFVACALALLATACATDPLYTYCDDPVQCGSRTYGTESDEYTVDLACVEVQLDVEPGRTTRGSFCTLDCRSDADCDSRVGLGDGLCIQWEADAGSYCYQRCSFAADCYPSSTCETVSLDGSAFQVCIPGRV